MNFREEVQNWLKTAKEDPLVTILSKNSHLTATQLETLLIDVLAANLSLQPLKYEEKAKLRSMKAAVSRGSFNRTLRQAKQNIIKSIYTILLLGYFGILDDPDLAPYIEVANRLKTYTKAYRDLLANHVESKEQLQVIQILREELQSMFDQLSRPWVSHRT
ncbi:MAG: hypothetical protein NWE78_05365 [Candidatus Bathyarchaeota archaeon]|nr:hypothetical protein [Candidatus Bathyarchaeota archaeon]